MKILIAEDDRELSQRLYEAIVADGFLADQARDGEEAHYLGETGVYDAVLLDLGLPQRDGLDVLKAWRQAGNKVPVLILTARGRWSEKREGFNAGADDYLTKPFNMEEAVIRLRALIRRSSGFAAPLLHCGALELDSTTSVVKLNGQEILFTAQEFKIIEFLLHRLDQVVSRLVLIDHVYGTDADPDSNVLDVLIGRIRKKIGGEFLVTVRGRGYRLRDPTS
ncbi:MAG: response regulator transcription factor [Gammaproteobacteria bacterium]